MGDPLISIGLIAKSLPFGSRLRQRAPLGALGHSLRDIGRIFRELRAPETILPANNLISLQISNSLSRLRSRIMNPLSNEVLERWRF